MNDTPFTMHVAGPYECMKQYCVMCGKLLIDYSNACWPEGQGAPQGWPEGHVYQQGSMTQTAIPEEYVPCIQN